MYVIHLFIDEVLFFFFERGEDIISHLILDRWSIHTDSEPSETCPVFSGIIGSELGDDIL